MLLLVCVVDKSPSWSNVTTGIQGQFSVDSDSKNYRNTFHCILSNTELFDIIGKIVEALFPIIQFLSYYCNIFGKYNSTMSCDVYYLFVCYYWVLAHLPTKYEPEYPMFCYFSKCSELVIYKCTVTISELF